MRTRESEEMYLETIYRLQEKKSAVRSVDVVEELGYAKSSVSRGVNLLVKKGYIVMADSGEISLTATGRKKASDIYERHCVLTEILMRLGADHETAEENACRIEHVITSDMFALIKKYVGETQKSSV